MRSSLLLRALLFVAATAGSLYGQETNSDHRFPDETKVRADQGDAAAECFIGDAYSIGMGAAEDAVEAVKWYRKAAEQGFGVQD